MLGPVVAVVNLVGRFGDWLLRTIPDPVFAPLDKDGEDE